MPWGEDSTVALLETNLKIKPMGTTIQRKRRARRAVREQSTIGLLRCPGGAAKRDSLGSVLGSTILRVSKCHTCGGVPALLLGCGT